MMLSEGIATEISRLTIVGSFRLNIAERAKILLGVSQGLSIREIARQLGRAPSTVSRELNANGGSVAGADGGFSD